MYLPLNSHHDLEEDIMVTPTVQAQRPRLPEREAQHPLRSVWEQTADLGLGSRLPESRSLATMWPWVSQLVPPGAYRHGHQGHHDIRGSYVTWGEAPRGP